MAKKTTKSEFVLIRPQAQKNKINKKWSRFNYDKTPERNFVLFLIRKTILESKITNYDPLGDATMRATTTSDILC